MSHHVALLGTTKVVFGDSVWHWFLCSNNTVMIPSEVLFISWTTAFQNQQNDVHPAKTQISLGIRTVWSESSLSACMKKAWVLSYPLSAQRRLRSDWANAQSDLSLCWARIILLVLSCCGSIIALEHSQNSICGNWQKHWWWWWRVLR